jgi:anhydro-N-acetylmuramic acid kinase
VQNFDENGRLAQRGTIRPDILQELQAHPYVKAPFPKSTGPEVFGVDLIWQIIAKYRIEPVQYYDLLATFSRFSAEAVYTNYHQFFADKYPLDEIIASGGGVHNPVIMEHLQTLFAPVKIARPEAYGIPADGKEALAFAMLAALFVWQISGNVPNVTGARHPVVLGKLTL